MPPASETLPVHAAAAPTAATLCWQWVTLLALSAMLTATMARLHLRLRDRHSLRAALIVDAGRLGQPKDLETSR